MERTMTHREMLECLTWLRAFQEMKRHDTREALPRIEQQTFFSLKYGPLPGDHDLRYPAELSDGSFERIAAYTIRHRYDITTLLDYREKLILAGKVEGLSRKKEGA